MSWTDGTFSGRLWIGPFKEFPGYDDMSGYVCVACVNNIYALQVLQDEDDVFVFDNNHELVLHVSCLIKHLEEHSPEWSEARFIEYRNAIAKQYQQQP